MSRRQQLSILYIIIIYMHSDMYNPNLSISQIRSNTTNELYNSQAVNYHRLPPISQPLLTKYRSTPNNNSLIIQQSSSLWCQIFGHSHPNTTALCKCQKIEEGYCELVMSWINQFYDWKNDKKFVKAYQNYTRRSIDIFINDYELANRLDKKLQILNMRISEKYKIILLRVCKNYLKHSIYYGKSEILTKENDLWMWFLLGIFYHIGSSLVDSKQNKHEQEIMFWSVDIAMNSLGAVTRVSFLEHAKKVIKLIKDYFLNWFNQLMQLGIHIQAIIVEWLNQLMIGFAGVESIGFFISCLLKAGWTYVYKVVLSFFQKRMLKMQNDEIFLLPPDRQLVMKQLMNCSQEWPLIFYNANSFVFDQL